MNETLDEFGATVRFGTVSASKPGFARVRLAELGNLRTMWLPIAYPKTQHDQCCWTYDEGEQVAVLMDGRGEDGVILGAIYSAADRPPVSDPNKFTVRFKDGATLEYDRATHVLACSGVARVVVEASAEIVLRAGEKVTVVAPQAEFSANVTVKGKLTYEGGMAGSGGAGASIAGNVKVDGNIEATGSIIDAGGNSNHHSH
ncbi:phage baseplate assembly protein V [Burkholderia thailandensis]|uniref:Phage baseplate assembly V family protein n=1 Tax=Burkholderia thailandensis TaxID=57975 RepID=A0AAW9CQS9_BURTH|nr:phage baseplate assembly protein V [Burkholderia thailandensis]AHI67851.1 phage baseplate assembly V family protein [Burkholderia thailandensis H0587]AIP66220.1 baseplate protein [Burkholderia thailandensis]AOI54283.1 baseplate protein [Burkholderia thailandensis]AOJ53265.1 baseplate protein [Burkholderia thailandensis]AVR28614.1 phage baseplate assembly protein V [Burkholderia thailandensis]